VTNGSPGYNSYEQEVHLGSLIKRPLYLRFQPTRTILGNIYTEIFQHRLG